MVQYKKGILYTILFAIIRRKETTLMKRKWLFASLLLTAALTMTSCSFKLPVDLPFKIPFITADRNTKQNDEDPSDPEKATDPIITDEPEVLENIDTTENTPSGNDHESNTPDDADPSPSGQENSVDIPVLMGGALPYTGMISLINENYEDGTHRYDDMLEDGMSCIVDYCYVNPEDLPDTPEAYATLAAAVGKYVSIGDGTYSNMNLTLIDDWKITIGKNVLIGPNVTLCTTGHPIDPEHRGDGMYSFPITIGDNVWLGANVVVLPDVTIGENSVIGAGSVVTKDIPANCIAFGSPCKVYREINAHDKEYYFKNHRFDEQP